MLPKLSWWLLLLAIFTTTAQAAKFRAVLIGINYVGADPAIPPLAGAVADMHALRDVMMGTLGIPAQEIHTVQEQQATRDNIIQEINQWLIDTTVAGDWVFVSYAGHGTQVPDTSTRQRYDPDKINSSASELQLAEALVPYDTVIDTSNNTTKNLILDHELHRLLSKLTDRHVTLWLDSCHSGGATRGEFGNSALRAREFTLPWLVGATAAWNSRVLTAKNTLPAALTRNLSYGYFAAARHFQKAYEIDGRGIFTQGLTELLTANPHASYTNQQILSNIQDHLQHKASISPSIQEPALYPHKLKNQTFALLERRNLNSKPSSIPIATTPTPFGVKLWLDAVDKKNFTQRDWVTLYYQVPTMPYSEAYFTLFNRSPNGTWSMLYPQAATDTANIVIPKKTYTIPSSANLLHNKPWVETQLRLRLTQTGAEYFTAIVTPHPLTLDIIHNLLGIANNSTSSIAVLKSKLTHILQPLAPSGWGEGELQVTVTD